VIDASLRLVRAYVATRSLDGQSAFFHGSVREYVYARLEPSLKAELHERAAAWYKREKEIKEAEYHLAAAENALGF
jgi:ATP/maltotriose-dependent transcriptional regulator MalT